MIRLRLRPLMALLCLVPLTTSAREPRVVNGVYTSEYPTVGALLKGPDAESAGAWCTGTMIGCQTFLTAAHCVCDDDGPACQPSEPGAPNPGEFFVFLQHAGVFAVSSIAVRTDYAFPTGDVAVVTLSTPVTGIRPTPLQLTGAPAFGTAGTIVGFGRSGDGNDDYLLKRVGAVETADCDRDSNTTLVCWDYENPVGPPGTDSNTCNGDSGGPLFVGGACGMTIAGITSGGTTGACTPSDHSYDANVYTYRSYIQTEGGADVSNVACGAMPQIGEAGTVIDAATGSLSVANPEDTHVFNVGAGLQALRISMNGVDENGADFDLYVKAGSPATTASYDCRAIGSNQVGYCAFGSPAAGDWYVLVRRATGSGVYQVTATTIAPGVPGTGGGGVCDDGNACTSGDACVATTCVGAPAVDGTVCDDGSACTGTDVCTGGVCAGTAAPLVGCLVPDVPLASSMSIKDSLNDTGDSLSWKWTKGTSTVPQFGNPMGTTRYELCLFDESAGVPAVASSALVPPGGNWTATSSGFKYRDRAGLQGGVKALTLKTTTSNRATIRLKAKGVAFATPALPLSQDPGVVAQLTNGTTCWAARYETNTKNDGVRFRAKSD